jgi:hypothetical protein
MNLLKYIKNWLKKSRTRVFICPACGEVVKEVVGIYIHPPNSCEYSEDGIIYSTSDNVHTFEIADNFLQSRLKKVLK